MNTRLSVDTKGGLLNGKAPGVIQANLDRFITQVTMFLLVEVQKRTPQGVYGAQGGLIGSEQAEVTGQGTPQVKGAVMSSQKYVEVIEKGRRPGKGMPPTGTLVRWLEVKLGLSDIEAQRIEYVVRRKIGIKGFEGRHMFEYAVTENQTRLEQMAAACGLSIVSDLNG